MTSSKEIHDPVQKAFAAVRHCTALCLPSQRADHSPPRDNRRSPDGVQRNPTLIPLYGTSNPGSRSSENWASFTGIGLAVRNVTYPTLTPVFPKEGTANGAAVVVAPGGGFMMLAMEHEGWKVANALADRGFTAFVLKYRLLVTPAAENEAGGDMARRLTEGVSRDPTKMPDLQFPPSTEDGLAALALVRSRAAEWHVDPNCIGMIGFSAGAMTALNTALAASEGKGPAFIGYIYGPQARVEVPANASPLFDAIAFDDQFFPTMGFPLAAAWHAAGHPVEVHAYQQGNHGFGLGIPGTTTAGVIDQFITWLDMQSFTTSKR
jgi:acetyl esterase/lipase